MAFSSTARVGVMDFYFFNLAFDISVGLMGRNMAAGCADRLQRCRASSPMIQDCTCLIVVKHWFFWNLNAFENICLDLLCYLYCFVNSASRPLGLSRLSGLTGRLQPIHPLNCGEGSHRANFQSTTGKVQLAAQPGSMDHQHRDRIFC
jgi:hypothetical protein